jgi:ABC-2 type transport system ATP-binding protein
VTDGTPLDSDKRSRVAACDFRGIPPITSSSSARGRLIADLSVAELTSASRHRVRVRSPEAAQLREALAGPQVTITSAAAGVLEIDGLTSEAVGRIAAERGFMLYELVPQTATLEDAFMELTSHDVEYRGTAPAGLAAAGREA